MGGVSKRKRMKSIKIIKSIKAWATYCDCFNSDLKGILEPETYGTKEEAQKNSLCKTIRVEVRVLKKRK